MGDKTPKRSPIATNNGFSPVILTESPAAASPQKNLTGLPRLVRDLVADIYNNIQRWNDLHIKGATHVKEIASVKADNSKDFSKSLEQSVNKLYELVQSLRFHKDFLMVFAKQIRASEKLQKQSEPLFISLDAKVLANLIEEISEAYEAEFKIKEFILENIAYSKNKNEAMFLAALWTYQTKINNNITLKIETLLIETGHRKIT